jgi:hypothetical protein
MLTENEITLLKNTGISKYTTVQCDYCKCRKPVIDYLMGFSSLTTKESNKNMCDLCENKINHDLEGAIKLKQILNNFNHTQYPENIYWELAMKLALNLKTFFNSDKFIDMELEYTLIKAK